MRTICTGLLLIILAGCARPYTQRERILFTGMVAAQAADYYTTERYLDIGGTEANPLCKDTALFKVGVTAFYYGLGQLFPEKRETIFTVGIVSGVGAAAWNDRLYERYK